MLSEQILTKKVVDFLRETHSIRLNLPNLFRSIDSKVTLKYLKSFPITKKQNRYQILAQRIQELLKRNLLNLDKIKLFSEDFFNTITEDLLILQENEKLRRKIPLAKQQILMKNGQIGGFEQNIKAQCVLINDKQDIINFISSSLKDYLGKLNIIANEYNNVNKLQILTSINIDDLYQDNLTDQGYYLKHYPPLVEVLNKLKSNMIRLYQEIQTSDPYDVPLKCVNFLANCKNLIQEMEPFLLSNDCAFNKMIFFVVKCQKENLQLVASNYQKALVFCREITFDLFKSYFLGFMFKPNYLQIKQSLEAIRQSLLKLINDEQLPQIKLSELLKAQVVKLQVVNQQVRQLQGVMSIGKSSIMKQYVNRKQCKKTNLVVLARNEYVNLKSMIDMFSQYYQIKKYVQRLQNKQFEQSTKVIKQIKMLEKINEIHQLGETTQTGKNKEKISPQKRFEATFLKLQQLILQVSTLKGQLELQLLTHHDEQSHNLLLQYITHRIQKLTSINSNYQLLQTKLLNTYLTIQTQAQKLQQQSVLAKQQTIASLQNYFDQRLSPSLGFIISNEDNFCEQVKAKIMELGKAEYMIREWKKDSVTDEAVLQHSKKDQDEIKFYRNNLQWLLILFEGSMDDKIFEMMMDKLNFQSQDYLQKDKKLHQFITELNKYVNDLKNLLKTHPLSQIHQKIYKIIKDRIQLYEILSDIYSQCLLVFKQTKIKDPQFNIQSKGLMLFDEDGFKYVLMLYQFRNKLRMEMSELKELMLPPRAKNYLIDELYEPFAIRYGQFVNFKEDELLNLTLRLQHALNIQQSQKKIITVFEEVIDRAYNEEYFTNLQQLCRQLSQIHNENNLVLQLQNEPVVIHNLAKFKQLVEAYRQYYKLAEQIFKDLCKQEQTMKSVKRLQLKNPKTLALKLIVINKWQQANGIKPSGNYQRSNSNLKDNNSNYQRMNSNYQRRNSNNERLNNNRANQNNDDENFDKRSNYPISRVESKVSGGSKYSQPRGNQRNGNVNSRLVRPQDNDQQ